MVAAVPGTATAATQEPAWRTSLFEERIDPERGHLLNRDAASVAPDGSAVVAWFADRARSDDDARRLLRVALTDGRRRFGAPRVVARRGVTALAAAAAPRGAALVAWSARGRLRVAVRSRVGARLIVHRPRDRARDE